MTILCLYTRRLDFVKGFAGQHVADYMAAAQPAFVVRLTPCAACATSLDLEKNADGHLAPTPTLGAQVGEFWDTLAYQGSTLEYNQDAHRQRTVAWINAAGGAATAFDVTTKGAPRCRLCRRRPPHAGATNALMGYADVPLNGGTSDAAIKADT